MKVNDITFDSSDSVIFIATSGSNGNVNVKKGILSNPDRIFIDIQDAVLTRKQGAYDFKNGKLLNFKISQFSTEPNVVRAVMTCSSQIKPKDIQVLTIGGNIIIKMQEYKLLQDFLTPI
ncbi:MAG: AMIN domain-containing protein, partial [Candidatus Gastranaerophilaceae bacterium]